MTRSVYLTSLVNINNEALKIARHLIMMSTGIKEIHDPNYADVIFYIDNGYHGLSQISTYFEALKTFSQQQIIVYSETDCPLPCFPGAYPSLSGTFKKEEPYFSWCFISASHSNLYTRRLRDIKPYYLFSFLGRVSTHPVRKKISRLHSPFTPCLDVNDAKIYFSDYSYSSTYYNLLQSSKFILCPRGFGRGSIRTYEAMSLGRVPVIISDGWKEHSEPDISSCSIRIEEKDIEKIPQILAACEDQAEELGQKARKLFEHYFAPEVFLEKLIEQACKGSESVNLRYLMLRSLLKYGLVPNHIKTWIADTILDR
ncbi:exostosin family protein [Calothrix membranacea FACHB-236]|nr:exostosin family protein [Calothrix membranacea FACHB-236]